MKDVLNPLPLVSMDEHGLHVLSHKVSNKLSKKNLSASLVTALVGETSCAARWLFESFVKDEIIEELSDTAARRGSIFHKIMEDLFALEPEQRTKAQVKKLVTATLDSDDFRDLRDNKDVLNWVREAVNGYYRMGGDPQKVTVANISIGDKTNTVQKGLEVFVKGTIGTAKRPVVGFVDRLVLDVRRNDGSVLIEDWKTGSKAKRWNPTTKSEEGLAEQRQQLMYKMLLEQHGIQVSGARLIYPVAQTIVNVDCTDEALMKRVVKNVEEADTRLDNMIETNWFEFSPFFLCSWCSLVRACPQAMVKPYAKMQEAFAAQPETEVLLKGVELL